MSLVRGVVRLNGVEKRFDPVSCCRPNAQKGAPCLRCELFFLVVFVAQPVLGSSSRLVLFCFLVTS